MTTNEQKATTSKKRAVGYIRVSDEKQNLKYGPKAQLADIEKYCAEQGYELIHVVYDSVTGVVWRERTGLTELRDMARRREFDIAVVGRFNRLAREDEIQTVIMEDLAYHHVKTESATEKIEDSPAGRFMLHVYGFMAEVDRKDLLKRTDDGRRARANDGKLLGGGPARYGYKWNEDRTAYLENDDVIKVDANGFKWTKAEVVKFAWRMAKEGWPIARIRFHLQNLGIPTDKGKEIWQDSMISNILGWEGYTGEATVYRYKYEWDRSNGKRSRVRTIKRPEEEQIKMPEGVVPALIDRETFEEVQKIKIRNRNLAARKNENPEDALLRCGLIYCGHCENTMYANHFNAKRVHGKVMRIEYACCVAPKRYGKCQGSRIKSIFADDAAWEYAMEIIRNPTLVNKMLDMQKKTDNTDNDLSPVERSIKKIDLQIKSYQRALDKAIEDEAEGEIIDSFVVKLDQLAKSKRVLEKEKRVIIDKQEEGAEEDRALEKFRQWCNEKREKFDNPDYTPTYKEKREACERLGIKVYVWREGEGPINPETGKPQRLKVTAHPVDIESIAS